MFICVELLLSGIRLPWVIRHSTLVSFFKSAIQSWMKIRMVTEWWFRLWCCVTEVRDWVESKENGSMRRSLRDSNLRVLKTRWWRLWLKSTENRSLKPRKSWNVYSESRSESVTENVVGDCIQCCWEVQETECREFSVFIGFSVVSIIVDES